jgi:hypothetical protein
MNPAAIEWLESLEENVEHPSRFTPTTFYGRLFTIKYDHESMTRAGYCPDCDHAALHNQLVVVE